MLWHYTDYEKVTFCAPNLVLYSEGVLYLEYPLAEVPLCLHILPALHCRVYLDHLRSPDEAVRIVKESKSTEGAKMVAKWVGNPCLKTAVVRFTFFPPGFSRN